MTLRKKLAFKTESPEFTLNYNVNQSQNLEIIVPVNAIFSTDHHVKLIRLQKKTYFIRPKILCLFYHADVQNRTVSQFTAHFKVNLLRFF